MISDKEYENILTRTALDFHDEFISNADRDDDDTVKIAVEYTMYILERFSTLLEEYENAQGQSN
jgi:hypothetical protein